MNLTIGNGRLTDRDSLVNFLLINDSSNISDMEDEKNNELRKLKSLKINSTKTGGYKYEDSSTPKFYLEVDNKSKESTVIYPELVEMSLLESLKDIGKSLKEPIKRRNKFIIDPEIEMDLKGRTLVKFTLGTWNLLSDGLSGLYANNLEKAFKKEKNETLLFQDRFKRIIEIIAFYEPLILLVQELDFIHSFSYVMIKRDYKIYLSEKTNGHSAEIQNDYIKHNSLKSDIKREKFHIKMSGTNEHNAILIKKTMLDVFDVKEVTYFDTRGSATVCAICMLLIHKKTKKEMLIITTHLKAGQNKENESIRLGQIKEIFEMFSIDTHEDAILAGDLNSDIFSKVYDSEVDEYLKWKGFRNSFREMNEGIPFSTSAKTRKTKIECCIDHIYYKSKDCLYPFGVLMQDSVIDFDAPNRIHPSDHFIQMTHFNFLS